MVYATKSRRLKKRDIKEVPLHSIFWFVQTILKELTSYSYGNKEFQLDAQNWVHPMKLW